VNDCVLFQKEYSGMETCPTCGESRWKSSDSSDNDKASGTVGTKKCFPHKSYGISHLFPDYKDYI
jgi:hypothetical protein